MNGTPASDTPVVSAIESCPLTQKRAVPVGLEQSLPQPYLARANAAVSKEVPQGSPPHLARRDLTVLQQHVAFFDRWGCWAARVHAQA
jgi:peroxygenase